MTEDLNPQTFAVTQRGVNRGKLAMRIVYIIFVLLSLYFFLRTVFYIVWKLDSDDESVRITFSVFKKLYPLYPSKWSLDDSYVVYRPNENSWDNYVVEFKTFHDVLMYKIFKYKIEREEKNIRNDKTTRDFLKELQKDIDKYREENFSEMKNALGINEG